ncbi:double-strand break repair helicase AddA [Erythrobacter sp. EC-HK427]|uniref:double-strand break repair helicase AddA n=1 Tax=Erythrobacter sp. EC-HK427 TaxID=2038396 RepID=UPI0012582D7C|nr:DNA helicase [Erythrobacter sp. EC-HK427]
MSGTVYPLKGSQREAVEPQENVWLSASAGTGKTQVLSARVLRLLLTEDVRPEQILCLTFTKAGAAEMAERVNDVLARWVRMPATELFKDLRAIGAEGSDAELARARSLFASVLDCPGGGLRIDTIHAFAQWLLSAFPEEAELLPGTRPMEDRDRDLLAEQVLRDLLLEWEAGDPAAVAALEELSRNMAPDKVRGWLLRCAKAREAWEGPGGWQSPMRDRVLRLLGLPAEATMESLSACCADDTPAIASVRQAMWAFHEWGTPTGQKIAEAVGGWLLGTPQQRFEKISDVMGELFNKEGVFKNLNNLSKKVENAKAIGEEAHAWLTQVADQAVLFELAQFLTPALETGRKFAMAWQAAKAREGFVDFDDLIHRAAALLTKAEMSDWIRYKLDREFDHILVDEAQDTNAQQWEIIGALTDDFFSGEGQKGNRQRTIFVVGDYKQAIFGFQGTSPQNFAQAQKRYAELLRTRKENWARGRDAITVNELRALDLGRSFRTAQPILEFVDHAIAAIGHDALGLDANAPPHEGEDRAGIVRLWQPVPAQGGEASDDEAEDGSDFRLTPSERRMADGIAKEIRRWLDEGFPLEKGKHRNATPGDIMILVRKRGELVNPIVARLHARGVPVAGVDRLRLGAPLAVKDLMAALRFAAQPLDDLSLANLLVSPIFGWSQEQLLEHGYRPDKRWLWEHLRGSDDPFVGRTVAALRDLLALADFEPPQALLHWMLTGPWRARAKLVARLGSEVNDPIDELLNAALQFSASHTPSLQGFIRWFDAGDGELKREAEGAGGLVRVMTVHGSKGLQAPIVILADACVDPDASKARDLALVEETVGDGPEREIPIIASRKEQRVGRIGEVEAAQLAADKEEHWRLLYVAMTRAEEALFIGGALNQKSKDGPKPDSWFARLEPLFDGDWLAGGPFGAYKQLGRMAAPVVETGRVIEGQRLPLPDWAVTPIGAEPRPPRPLAPSGGIEDSSADPPLPSAEAAAAARRGVLIHALLERLPDVPVELRDAGGRAWLARHGEGLDESERADILARAIAVLEHPDWRDLFSPGALPEVPLAATVGTQVIAGTADRLLVRDDSVLVVDYKTARRPPQSLAQIPPATLRQMAAYVAALQVIYPGRTVSAAVLYTQTPRLFALPAEMLAAHAPGETGSAA